MDYAAHLYGASVGNARALARVAMSEMSTIVVSWNIQKGIGMDFRRDLDRTARVLAATNADVVALQEVMRTERVDQAGVLARALGMELAWGAARTMRGGTFGNAALVRGEVTMSRVHDLSVRTQEKRACLETVVRTRGTSLRLFVCHFGLGFRERAYQARRLGEILRAAPRDCPRVVLGDFNEWYVGPVHRALASEFPEAPSRMPTHPSFRPIFALDRIAWDAPLEGDVRVMDVARASDHRLLHASLR